MFRKYEKTFRIPGFDIKGKAVLSHKEVQALLTGRITVEEKIDGANVGIIGGKKDKIFRLQKRGSLVDFSEHPQFGRFKAWTSERFHKLMGVRYPYIIYGEFMWATHHIFYDSLPDWFICFDIWDGQEFVGRRIKEKFCESLHIEVVPLVYEGYVSNVPEVLNMVYGQSEYSSDHDREGIVVKNCRKQMRGKIVRPEFIKEIDEDGKHWMTRWDPREVNKLR
jgi:ATP-dependent RNA circularization protein (DNA/RNA ligase family)